MENPNLKNFVKDVLEKKFSNRAKLVEKSKYVKAAVNNKVKIAKLVAFIKELVFENKLIEGSIYTKDTVKYDSNNYHK